MRNNVPPKHKSIAITCGMVVMLFSCFACGGRESKEQVEVVFDAEHTYTMRTTDVSSLVSDSGRTRFRLQAKQVLIFDKAADPYMYFPQGIYIERFDSLLNVEASIRADTAYHWDRKGLAKLTGNVEIQNLEGERFKTSLLYWDRKAKRFYSDAYIRIERHDRVISGTGFESNESMTQYTILRPQGTFLLNE